LGCIPLTLSNVIAGLDPVIHLHAKKMDPWVKPAGDEQKGWITSWNTLWTARPCINRRNIIPRA